MFRTLKLAAGVTLTLIATASGAEAQRRVEVGLLTCKAQGARGFIVGLTRHLQCRFERRGRDEYYGGTIDKYGLDVGRTRSTTITWAVLAPTANLPPRSLRGTYAGVSAEATVGPVWVQTR